MKKENHGIGKKGWKKIKNTKKYWTGKQNITHGDSSTNRFVPNVAATIEHGDI